MKHVWKDQKLHFLEEGNRGWYVDNRLNQALGEGANWQLGLNCAGSELLPQLLGRIWHEEDILGKIASQTSQETCLANLTEVAI